MFCAEELRETLERIASLFSQSNIAYHFTGGLASSFYGEPRLTQDIDVVIDAAQLKQRLGLLSNSLTNLYYLNMESIVSALGTGSIFQLLDKESMIKIDCYPRQMVPGELQRSQEVELIPGLRLPVLNKQDAVLAKLLWIKKGSHKSRKDARMMIKTKPELDLLELHSRASELGVAGILNEILTENESGIPD